MAKKEKAEQEGNVENLDATELSKLLIREFNKDGKEPMAWNLASDLDNPTTVKEFISTGSTLLDYAIANRPNGGVPVGKLTEISGEEASGKSLMVAHILANTQKKGGLAIYMDEENAANPEFLTSVGVNIKDLVYMQCGTCEKVGEQIEKVIAMVRAKAPDRLVTIAWDSVAATQTNKMLEGNYELSMDVFLEKSKVLSQMMSKLVQIWGKERICMVFTNQLKTKIGVQYGDPMTTPGGKAIPYYSSVRIRLNRSAPLNEGKARDAGRPLLASGGTNVEKGQAFGIHTRAKVFKNRMGPPLRACEFDILFSNGIDDVTSWYDYLHGRGEIEKDQGWCYIPTWPSGKLEDKGVHKGKDRGLKFREGDWKELVNADSKLKEHALKLIEKHGVVKYGEKPHDFDASAESLLDVEAVQEMVAEGM